MSLLEAIILGIVQGVAEFLPISSSGHLALFQQLFGISEPTMMFDVVLHVGTLIPVLIVYWKEIFKLLKKPFQKTTYMLVVATIPIVIAALFLNDYIESLLSSIQFLAFAFIITGCVLLLTDRIAKGRKRIEDMTYIDAALIGCMQAVAIVPGISRSGSTIAASLSRKLDRESAAQFSFLLSIPAILGALVLQLKHIITGDVLVESINFVNMGAGFIAAMLSGYLAINFMLKLIKKAKLSYFAYYVFGVAALILADMFLFGNYLFG